MTQSNVIAGAILGGFIVFITVRGELPDYVRLFTLKRQTANTSENKASNVVDGLIDDASDELIDIAGESVFGDVWTTGDRYI